MFYLKKYCFMLNPIHSWLRKNSRRNNYLASKEKYFHLTSLNATSHWGSRPSLSKLAHYIIPRQHTIDPKLKTTIDSPLIPLNPAEYRLSKCKVRRTRSPPKARWAGSSNAPFIVGGQFAGGLYGHNPLSVVSSISRPREIWHSITTRR